MLGQVDQQLEQYSDLASYITQVFARQVDRGVPVADPRFDHQCEEGFDFRELELDGGNWRPWLASTNYRAGLCWSASRCGFLRDRDF